MDVMTLASDTPRSWTVQGVDVNSWAQLVLEHPQVIETQQEIIGKLLRLSPEDLPLDMMSLSIVPVSIPLITAVGQTTLGFAGRNKVGHFLYNFVLMI
jgi:hypothetical protein